jgi:hypothetical protein
MASISGHTHACRALIDQGAITLQETVWRVTKSSWQIQRTSWTCTSYDDLQIFMTYLTGRDTTFIPGW